MLPFHQLKRQRTLTEQAADAIRARIVGGEFQLGEALSEITLAAELGVSKTPVREAFLQLKNEGLVDIQPQRGTFVFQMTVEQIRQLTVLRELLEVGALRLACCENTGSLAGILTDIVARMAKAIDALDHRLYRQLDHDLHLQIIAGSRNQFIEAAYGSIAFRIQALRNRLALKQAQNLRSLEEHRDLVQSMRENDAARAVTRLMEHIRVTSREYILYFEQPDS